MRRWFFWCRWTLWAAVLAATVGLWVRSIWYGDIIRYDRGPVAYLAHSRCGEVSIARDELSHPQLEEGWSRFSHERSAAGDRSPFAWYTFGRASKQYYDSGFDQREYRLLGLGYMRDMRTWPTWWDSYHAIYIPHWLIVAGLVGLGAWRWWRWRHRPGPGCCRQCGYDLRASESTCPECGAVIPADLVRKPLA